MADTPKDPIQDLKNKLIVKASLKQRVYSTVKSAFDSLRAESKEIVSDLFEFRDQIDPAVILEVSDMHEHEFSIHFGGDLMVVSMQTNIVTFPNDYYLMKSPLVVGNPDLKYFGQILIYNFMADSMKYNRLKDSGYLMGRILINVEGNFVLEGIKGFQYMFSEMTKMKLDKEHIRYIILRAMDISIDNDLTALPFKNIQRITLGEQISRQKEAGWDQKIGFQMSFHDDSEPQ